MTEDTDPTAVVDEQQDAAWEDQPADYEADAVDEAGPVVSDSEPGPDASPIPLAECFSDVSLDLPADGVSFDLWARFGPNLLRMEAGHQWWLGDWAAYGDQHWGEDTAQVIDAERFDPKSVEVARWVATKIPKKDRHPGLTFTHHKIAAGLPSLPMIRKALKRAVSEQMTTRELRTLVDSLKPVEDDGKEPKRKAVHTWNLSFSFPVEHEQTGDRIQAQLLEQLELAMADAGISLDLTGVKISPSKS